MKTKKILKLKLVDAKGLPDGFTEGKSYAIVKIQAGSVLLMVLSDYGAKHPIHGARFGLKEKSTLRPPARKEFDYQFCD